MTTLFNSIRWRVQAWHALILLLALLAFCLTAYKLAWDSQLSRIDRDLASTERALIRSLMRSVQPESPGPNAPPMPFSQLITKLQQGTITLPPETAALFQNNEPGHAFFEFQDQTGTTLLRSQNFPKDHPQLLPVTESEMLEDTRTEKNTRASFRSSSSGLRSMVGRDITPELIEMNRFAWTISALGLGVWTLGLIGGWWLAGRAIRPIETISRTASHIAEGNLQERIDTDGTDSELDQLSRVLNQTFERLHNSFERQKQFTADASHELRTPVTILLSETQRLLKRTDRTPEEYREALLTCQQTAQRMRHLIEALLLLSKQETQSNDFPKTPFQLDQLLTEVVTQLTPLATEKNLQLQTHFTPTPCVGDPSMIHVLATNLLMNAIQHHHHPSGKIDIHCAPSGHHATFAVQDNGPGIPPEHLPHLFDRFYRVDKARTGSSGHTGLGLAIAKTIVTNHNGEITVTSHPGQGTTFKVQL
ncbi:HAMP domain-containing protein [Phragmitibacter flavus]|uniref:histidine kinase n=1 Tax=Phragmitibacter flavus TaxID=2576071 RepID=A0A5R8KAH8_9BACT|nr:ATP-binding protein [Phragmitibacter flavus]TLD68925.1 HAMP domain-containing protein [Phragmitibacter flavus]